MPEDADDKEIKAAYRQAALAYHPDHIPKGVSKRMREDAAQTWLEIQEAFAVLSDPAKRQEYDTLLDEMRQSEEFEQQFEPPAPPPSPPKPKPAPPPTPQQPTPQSGPQPQSTPQSQNRSKVKALWLSLCFGAGRHWRKSCWLVTGILYVVNGERNPETWTATLISCAIFVGLSATIILVASDVARKNKVRYVVNAGTVISLIITGIFTSDVSTTAPASRTVAKANNSGSSLTAVPGADNPKPVGQLRPLYPQQLAAGATLTLDVLSNMTYRLAYADRGGWVDVVKLVNSEERKEGGFWRLDREHIAFGDLNGDGVDDAVVVLEEWGGGTGLFFNLVTVIRRNGRLETPAVADLGDSIKINEIAIRHGIVTVDMITQGPNDPRCCPTERQVRKLAVRGNSFISVQ